MTAHDVVNRVRRITGVKQCGHSGTLDPMATGVLPVALGQACRLIRFLPDDKIYEATVLFGRSTTTDDIEGDILETSHQLPSLRAIQSELSKFQGRIEQYPPLYSAIHVGGRRLYEMARNGEIPAEIPKRIVEIFSIEILQSDDQETGDLNQSVEHLRLRIHCGSGTYIRSIARDLGQNLSVPACLSKLQRTKAGRFGLNESLSLEQLKNAVEGGQANNALLPIEAALDLPRAVIDDELTCKLRFGQRIMIPAANLTGKEKYIQAISNEKLIAICQPLESDQLKSMDEKIELKSEVVIAYG